MQCHQSALGCNKFLSSINIRFHCCCTSITERVGEGDTKTCTVFTMFLMWSLQVATHLIWSPDFAFGTETKVIRSNIFEAFPACDVQKSVPTSHRRSQSERAAERWGATKKLLRFKSRREPRATVRSCFCSVPRSGIRITAFVRLWELNRIHAVSSNLSVPSLF